ncbi:MAG TPA: hypothetical protein VEC11_15580 [Allosphingosinicella sp.]|nr:hypothetical protein [Allosphingosinicella sp.]
MTRLRWTTEEECEAEERQDERNAKGCLHSLGCVGDGCLPGALAASCIALMIWTLV